jgi:DNA polymerase-1
VKIIATHDLTPESMAKMGQSELLWVYNGLDCCVTAEVLNVIKPQLDNTTNATYEFSKSLQAPVLEMRLRGVLVDEGWRQETILSYDRDLQRIKTQLDRILAEGIGYPINWNSPAQLKNLLYRVLGLPIQKKRNQKGQYVETADRDALEKLDQYFLAQPIISHILALRDIGKKIGVLRTSVDKDGRMRTSYNIAGTTTGRFSSSLSDFGTGTNLQNIEERLRRPFIADPGMKFAYIDLEQAESRLVGAIEWNLFGDPRYLDACESGDLHTSVCRLAWTELGWTGDLKKDREIADQPFYRQHSYRHMAKVLGHGTNYAGKPYTMAKHTKLEAPLISAFQSKYFNAFPSHLRWHAAVQSELLTRGSHTTITGRRRWFFGRRTDDTTVREAIAYGPQGAVGDILNAGMLAVWRSGLCQLLLQIHDAILVQYPEDQEDIIVPQLLELIKVPIELNNGRTLIIPSEAQVGWNWAKQETDKHGNVTGNPDGITKYRPNDPRKRSPPTDKLVGLLDRVF